MINMGCDAKVANLVSVVHDLGCLCDVVFLTSHDIHLGGSGDLNMVDKSACAHARAPACEVVNSACGCRNTLNFFLLRYSK